MKKIKIGEKTIDVYADLRNCPFCGSYNLNVYFDPGSWGYSSPRSHVECLDCGCNGSNMATKEEAITAWNNRKGVC